MKDPKAKALFSAFQVLFTTDEGADDNNDTQKACENTMSSPLSPSHLSPL
jgi:hypothetical protein